MIIGEVTLVALCKEHGEDSAHDLGCSEYSSQLKFLPNLPSE